MTSEYIAQMAPMLVLAGAMVAWLAQLSSTLEGYGFLPDVALGLSGSALAGVFVWAVVSANAGMLGMLGIGGLGAVLALAAQRALWHPVRARS